MPLLVLMVLVMAGVLVVMLAFVCVFGDGVVVGTGGGEGWCLYCW